MTQFPVKQAQAGNSSANTSSVKVPVHPDSATPDVIAVLNGASPFILMIVFIFVGKGVSVVMEPFFALRLRCLRRAASSTFLMG